VYSDSSSAFGEGFVTNGKGHMVGTRYVIPLPPYLQYFHNITIGVDYKEFQEKVGLGDTSGDTHPPVRYLPLWFSYNSSVQDRWGSTQFSLLLNMAFRGLVARQQNFGENRYHAGANFLYAILGIERMTGLPGGLNLFVKADGQAANKPLISNEQYSAGGMQNVRGYKESEAQGDNAGHITVELSMPDAAKRIGLGPNWRMEPYIFYDFATLEVLDALPGQAHSTTLQGTGVGVRGQLFGSVGYEVDAGFALASTDRVKRGDCIINFMVRWQF
jgi:hemolysin activation/secretion protein